MIQSLEILFRVITTIGLLLVGFAFAIASQDFSRKALWFFALCLSLGIIGVLMK